MLSGDAFSLTCQRHCRNQWGPEDYVAPGVQSAWNKGGAQVGAIWG